MDALVDFLLQPLVLLLLGALFGGVFLALGIHFFPILKNRKQGYAYEAEIEKALLPFLFKAIASAYRLSEHSVDEIGERLAGIDKARFAVAVYHLLPDRIGRYPVGLIKKIVSEEVFGQLVQVAFEDFLEFYEERHDDFIQLWEEWAALEASAE